MAVEVEYVQQWPVPGSIDLHALAQETARWMAGGVDHSYLHAREHVEEEPADERRAAAALDLAQAGARDARIEIVDHDETWPERFSRETARLALIVPGIEFHHVGSTAVPGLAAKPIIDMMAVVDDVDAPLPALTERAGYQCPAAYNALLVRRRWLCFPSAPHRTHDLHLVADPGELTRHLRFRDALRADPRLVREYAALKRAPAERMSDDREGYTAAKTAFIRRVETSL